VLRTESAVGAEREGIEGRGQGGRREGEKKRKRPGFPTEKRGGRGPDGGKQKRGRQKGKRARGGGNLRTGKNKRDLAERPFFTFSTGKNAEPETDTGKKGKRSIGGGSPLSL